MTLGTAHAPMTDVISNLIELKSLGTDWDQAVIVFLDIIHHPVSIENTQCFGGWILSPSSGGA
jgi:hypothetical protein